MSALIAPTYSVSPSSRYESSPAESRAAGSGRNSDSFEGFEDLLNGQVSPDEEGCRINVESAIVISQKVERSER